MHQSWNDALTWTALALIGLGLAAAAVYGGARLGTASAPFLGRYRWQLDAASLFAPAIAIVVVVAVLRGWPERARWHILQTGTYFAALAWAIALAFTDGVSGITRGLDDPDEYLSDLGVVADPEHFIRSFTDLAPRLSEATRGHPPGPLLLLWALAKLGVTDHLALGLLITAIGTLTVPLVLSAVRDSCGETAARRYAPLLALAPWAVWTAVSMDAVVAMLGAALIISGVRASRTQSRGWSAAGWALLAGLLIGLAALFAYGAPWLGLSVVCIYFARRRAFLNLVTGFGALISVAAMSAMGLDWVGGIQIAHADYTTRISPNRSVVWWTVLSLVALLLAIGPASWASLRKLRNTPAWPYLVGAGAAVLFTICTGLARGGMERAWLPFFPWLAVAAVAPERQGGRIPPQQVPLLVLGATTAIVIEAVLATPW